MFRLLSRIRRALSSGYRYRLEHPCETAREFRLVAAWAADRGLKRVEKRWRKRAERWEKECKHETCPFREDDGEG